MTFFDKHLRSESDKVAPPALKLREAERSLHDTRQRSAKLSHWRQPQGYSVPRHLTMMWTAAVNLVNEDFCQGPGNRIAKNFKRSPQHQQETYVRMPYENMNIMKAENFSLTWLAWPRQCVKVCGNRLRPGGVSLLRRSESNTRPFFVCCQHHGLPLVVRRMKFSWSGTEPEKEFELLSRNVFWAARASEIVKHVK